MMRFADFGDAIGIIAVTPMLAASALVAIVAGLVASDALSARLSSRRAVAAAHRLIRTHGPSRKENSA